MPSQFIEVGGPQTNQPDERTFREILDAINGDRRIVPEGFRAVRADEPQRRSQRQHEGAGDSIDDLVRSTLQSLVEKADETSQRQRKVEVILAAVSARMKQMDAEHVKFNEMFRGLEASIERIDGFISSVRVDPPPPPPVPQPIPPQLQPPPPQQQYAPPSAPPYQPQAYWPYNPR
jgi:hypothetical protein